MVIQKRIGLILAGIWLLCTGLIGILGLHFEGIALVMGLLAIAAGICLIFGV